MSVADQEIRTLRAQFWSARDPEGRAFAPLADAYRRKGELDEAESLVADGLARLPEFSPGHLVAGRIHRARGDLEEARASLDRVLALDGENVLALLERAELARELGDPDGAAERLRQLLSLAPGHMGARDALDRLEAAAPGAPDVEAPTAPEELEASGPLDEGEVDSPFSAEELVDADASFLGEEAQEEPVSAGLPEAEDGADEATGAISGDLEMFDFGLSFEEDGGADDEPDLDSDLDLASDPDSDPDLDHIDLDSDLDLDSLDRGVSALGDSLDPESEEDYLSTDIDLGPELEPGMEPGTEPEIEPGADPELESAGTERELSSDLEAQDDLEPSEGVESAGAPEWSDDFELTGRPDDADGPDPVAGTEPAADPAPVADPPDPVADTEPADDRELSAAPEPAAGLDSEDAVPEAAEGPRATPATRTMAEIFIRQGLLDRAVHVYERLLEDAPGSEDLRDRLEELRERGAVAVETPAGLPGGRTIRDHLDDLLAWVPGAVPIGDLAPDAPLDRAPPGSAAAARATGQGELGDSASGQAGDHGEARAAVGDDPRAAVGDDARAAVGDGAPGSDDAGARMSDGGSARAAASDDGQASDDAPGSDDASASDDDDLDDFHTWLESLQP